MTEQQLPAGWQMVKFGDIAKHISKRVEPSETDLDIYVGLEHLDPDSLKIKRHGTPSDVEGQKLLVKKGQIIFGKRRAYQRKVAVADWDCICSAHAMVLEANSAKVIPEFLPFFMQSDVFMNRAVAISEGSLSPTIKWKILAQQEFLIPPTDKQETYVSILKKISSVVASSERALAQANLLHDVGNDSNLLIVFYVQIVPDDFVMQLHR
ncbi:restriction endonuclease subunit S, partial [Klebsiella pneumoniae]